MKAREHHGKHSAQGGLANTRLAKDLKSMSSKMRNNFLNDLEDIGLDGEVVTAARVPSLAKESNALWTSLSFQPCKPSPLMLRWIRLSWSCPQHVLEPAPCLVLVGTFPSDLKALSLHQALYILSLEFPSEGQLHHSMGQRRFSLQCSGHGTSNHADAQNTTHQSLLVSSSLAAFLPCARLANARSHTPQGQAAREPTSRRQNLLDECQRQCSPVVPRWCP